MLPVLFVGLISVPFVKGLLPPCLFHEVTGWHCPGCGATRASVALVEFRWFEALRDNAFWSLVVMAGVPFAILAAARERFPGVIWLGPFRWRLGILWVLLGALVIFGIVRNLPGLNILVPD